MQKAFNNFEWRDYPSIDSPLSRANLMKVNNGLNAVDDRVINLDTTKFNKVDAQHLVNGFTLNKSTGVITIMYVNGSTATIQTSLSKVPDRLDYDPKAQKLVIVHVDGTSTDVDLSAIITQNEFVDSDTVDFQLQENGSITAIVKEGSIEEKHLRPNYLADIRIESGKAEAGAASALQSANKADHNAKLAQSYVVGTGGQVRPNDTDDNAKKYSENAQSDADTAKEYLTKVEKAGQDALKAIKDALNMDKPEFFYDFETGILYCESTRFVFELNNGILSWGLAV